MIHNDRPEPDLFGVALFDRMKGPVKVLIMVDISL